MNIILLSGGSGQRLWPLSNSVRSKQFIKLFKNDSGEYESMVQRVYHQIKAVDQEAKIMVATSKSQVSAIKNQLGEQVSICIEPCRRDTFPAIALAVSNLFCEKQIGSEEAVVICPVDPYVDHTYYEAVNQLGELAAKGDANITLMGIEPSYPSEKYGYIIPKTNETISKVKAFKEKPTVEAAREYLTMGALWNAGVFALKVGYLTEIAHKMLDFTDYQDLLSKYTNLPKISFDYAVVEKENNIQVMRYSGAWKDVGTWNMMAEVMADRTKGNVTLDDTCDNTNVVNELDIPILCMGCRDMVIAASSDGILVADKEQSSYMKPYVEKMGMEAMYAEKSWGTYNVVDVQDCFMTIKVLLNAGHRMKYHSHKYRDEVWTIVSGEGIVVLGGESRKVSAGDVIKITHGQKHTIIAQTTLNVVEVQIGEDIDVKDKELFEEELHGYHVC
ncbi:MAG: cupin domain-containing protein [Lachnospiraceae bacterium]|nr:cupin domain-containing protein [Lachnospiraceae bacterium]